MSLNNDAVALAASEVLRRFQANQPTALKAHAELRDRFATAALSGLLANAADDGAMGADDWARDAYLFADAMLKARGHE